MIKNNFCLLLLQLVLFINTATVFAQEQSLKALVLLNSSAVESKMAREYLIPYLEHFGILYETKEISELKTLKNLGAYPLIIISVVKGLNLSSLQFFTHTTVRPSIPTWVL